MGSPAATIRSVDQGLGVVSTRRLMKRLTAPVFGWHDVGVADIAWAFLLSALGLTSITGLTDSANHGGIGASLAVLFYGAGCIGQASAGDDGRRIGRGGRFELGFV